MYPSGSKDPRRGVHRVVSGPLDNGNMHRSSNHIVLQQGETVLVEYEYEDEYDDGVILEEDGLPVDIEESKKQLRRMSLQMKEIPDFSTNKRKGGRGVRASMPAGFKEAMSGMLPSEDSGEESETLYEEVFDDVDEVEVVEEEVVEEVVEVEELEVLEEEEGEDEEDETEVEEDVVEEEVLEEEVVDAEAQNEDPAPEEQEDEADEATIEEVKEAIVYILKQEKPIDQGYLTSEQATRMMALPLADMKEIMKHFELCDNAGEPICWNLIAEIVTPEGETPPSPKEDDDDDDDEDAADDGCGANTCTHGYGYCLECGVTGDPEASGSGSSYPSMGEVRDEVASLGSGFSLKANDENNEMDNSALSLEDDFSDSVGVQAKVR